MKKFLGAILALAVFLSGCSTMVAIRTEPDDASVKINGQPTGKTPINTELSNFDFDDYVAEIKKDGYKPLTTSLQKEFKVGQFIVGLLLWWPELLWVYGPKPLQMFELEPE
jgi:hypothetical protein